MKLIFTQAYSQKSKGKKYKLFPQQSIGNGSVGERQEVCVYEEMTTYENSAHSRRKAYST
jgi:hypothetical protein